MRPPRGRGGTRGNARGRGFALPEEARARQAGHQPLAERRRRDGGAVAARAQATAVADGARSASGVQLRTGRARDIGKPGGKVGNGAVPRAGKRRRVLRFGTDVDDPEQVPQSVRLRGGELGEPPPWPPVPIFAGSSTTSPHAALKWCAAKSACREVRHPALSLFSSSILSPPLLFLPPFFGLGLKWRRAGERVGDPKVNERDVSTDPDPDPISSSNKPVSSTTPLSRSCDCALGRAKVCAKRKSIRSCTDTNWFSLSADSLSSSPLGSVGSVDLSVAITTLAASFDNSRHRPRSSAVTAGLPPTGTANDRKRRCRGASAAGASMFGARDDAGKIPNSKGSRRSSTTTPSVVSFGEKGGKGDGVLPASSALEIRSASADDG